VVAGQPLIQLENLDVQSELAKVQADLQIATARATQNQLHYGDYGSAERERLHLVQEGHTLAEEAAKLRITSPFAGVVATARVEDLRGSDLDEGASILELIDDSSLVARIYVPEFSMHDIRLGSRVRLQVPSRFLPISGILESISSDWVPLDPSLGEKEQLAGINPPRFYAAQVWLKHAIDLHPGMTGTAKIEVVRRSLASFGWRFGRDLIARRIW